VFAGLLRDAAAGADSMTREHYQAAFLPLLFGVGLAIALTLFLRETGRATTPVPIAEPEIA